MEFLFPFPEDGHPPLSALGRASWSSNVDLSKDSSISSSSTRAGSTSPTGRVTSSPRTSRETIKSTSTTHYELQVKLYSLALVKALAIHSEAVYEQSFGGLFYVFLRSLRGEHAEPPGVYFERPSWADILGYEDELKRFDARSRGGRP